MSKTGTERRLLSHLPGGGNKLCRIWVDGGYSGCPPAWLAERFKFCLAGGVRSKQTKKFVLLPRRWVVERILGWLNHSRRLSKSYERLTRTDETWIYIANNATYVESPGLTREFPNSF